MKQAYFPEDMEIWLLTEFMSDKEEVESGFNRKTVYIKSGRDFLDAVASVKKVNGSPYAALILYKSVSFEVKGMLKQISELVSKMPNVNVYEVEREASEILGSFQYGSLNQLLADYKGVSRTEYIREVPQEDKTRHVLESLNLEIEQLKSKVESKEGEIETLSQTIFKKENEIKDLMIQLSQEKEHNRLELQQNLDTLTDKNQSLAIDLDVEKRKVLEYQERLRDLEEEVVSRKYRVTALEETLRQKEATLKLKDEEIFKRDERIRESQLEMTSLMLAGTSSEKYELLASQMESLKKDHEKTIKELEQSRVLLHSKQIEYDTLRDYAEELRKGHLTEVVLGRTNLLDKKELLTTDLVYIKIIDPLPYFNSAFLLLVEKLKTLYKNRVKTVLIRHNDGLDEVRFPLIPIYQSFDLVDSSVDLFRLHPSTVMFNGLAEYEEEVDLLIVVDYIQNSDYLLSTNRLSTTMTMVRRSEILKNPQSKLKGLPLTLGEESVYDLSFDASIARAGLRKNRERLLDVKVENWLSQLNVRR